MLASLNVAENGVFVLIGKICANHLFMITIHCSGSLVVLKANSPPLFSSCEKCVIFFSAVDNIASSSLLTHSLLFSFTDEKKSLFLVFVFSCEKVTKYTVGFDRGSAYS